MTILNIVDRRKSKYRWKRLNAVIENTWQDNSCVNSDQARKDCPEQVTYEHRLDLSLREAISWANATGAEVTLYLYDLGEGPEKTVKADEVFRRIGDAQR